MMLIASAASVAAGSVESSSHPPLASAVDLGRRLFYDQGLSEDGSVSCATCHVPGRSFSDGRRVSVGIRGRLGTRNAPSLLDAAVYTSFFWDGRARTLEDQVHSPILNPVEMGVASATDLVERIRRNPAYAESLRRLYGLAPRALTLADIARPIVAYERTLGGGPTALDEYLRGDRGALSVSAQRGLELFRGKAACSSCHVITDDAAPLTDNAFHISSVGLRGLGDLASLAMKVARLPQAERFALISTDRRVAALGRFVVTLDPRDIGKFRTPSLRYVAGTAPYMHDGSVPTLGALRTR